MKARKPTSTPPEITPALLRRRLPLPEPSKGGDKEERGRVLVVGGSLDMPGAVILAATAALRAGAGRLQIATCRSIAGHVGTAVPEARVYRLPETRAGGISPAAAGKLAELANEVQAVVLGPGMIDDAAVQRLVTSLVPRIERASVVVDATPLAGLAKDKALLHPLRGRAVVTPHAGEMAKITGLEKREVQADPLAVARRTAAEVHAVVALKGEETFIVGRDGAVYVNRAGNPGLGTSGSGDVLAGVIGGLMARGAPAVVATAWGVHLHARAGDRLAARGGQLGFLARELPAEIPPLLQAWSRDRQ